MGVPWYDQRISELKNINAELSNENKELKKEIEKLKLKEDKTHDLSMKIYKTCLAVMNTEQLILIKKLLDTFDPIK